MNPLFYLYDPSEPINSLERIGLFLSAFESEDHSKEPVELDFPTLHLREEHSNKPMGLINLTISKNTNKRQKPSNKPFQKHY